MCNRIILFIIFTFLFQDVFSQQYFIKSYNIENGLSTRLVYDVCQDSSGIIWTATHDGISSYDGFKFKNYDRKDGLPEQQYKRMICDGYGKIWCLPSYANDTLVYYSNNSFTILTPISVPDNTFTLSDFAVLYDDGKPIVCIGGDRGLYLFKNEVWKRIYVSDKIDENNVTRVVAKDNKFYISTRSGIFILEDEKIDRSLNDKLPLLGSEFLSLEFENSGKPDERLWVLSYDYLGYFEGNRFNVYKNDLQLPKFFSNETGFIGFHRSGRIFLGNNHSKYYISSNSDKLNPLMTKNGFSSNGAISIFIDREDNVWFADTRGVDKINKLSLVNYFVSNGLLDNDVTAIAEIKNGRYIFGHINGLSILESDNNFETIPFAYERLNSTRVLDIYRDKDGYIWFAASSFGVGKIYPDWRIKWYKGNDNEHFNSVSQDKNGKIWIGTSSKNNNIYIVENDKLVKYKFSDMIINTNRKLFASDIGGMYVLGSNGIFYADDVGVKRIPEKNGIKANTYSYYKNKTGTEFVGTAEGLYYIHNGLLEKYISNGIEISKPVYFILQDKEGNYWFGSNEGVMKWDGNQYLELINTQNGLAGNEANRSAGLLDSKGRIWIGTDLGLSCFMTEYIQSKIPVPKLKLLYLEDSKGINYNLDDDISVPYTDNTLQINFRGISFVNEESMVYKYKLDGYDNDWQEINQSLLDKVRYVNVSPGKYQFLVSVKNFSGEWSEVMSSRLIEINSPFYKSWWFITLSLLFLSGMIVSLVTISNQKYRNAKLAKEINFRKKVEQELIDSKIKYQDIIKLLPEAVYELDMNGFVSFINSFGMRLLDLTDDDLKSGVKITDIISSEEHSTLEANMSKILRNETLYHINYSCITKNGKKVPISVNAAPIMENGKIIGIRGVAVDMTEHFHIQEALIKYADELKALNASKDKFFSIVAHDLKSPFQGLLGFSEFLYNDFDILTEKEKKEYIGHVRSSARNAHNLLDNLLQWSRLQTGRLEVEPQKLNLYSVVNSVVELLIPNAVRKRITLLNNVNKFSFVTADMNMLSSIIRNLISNAIKFTKQDGVVLVESDSSEGLTKLKIIDNGIGINDEDIVKLFKIDQQITGIGTMDEKGTGLGLLLCKEMVELNGGSISVESESGKGSKFTVTLPAI